MVVVQHIFVVNIMQSQDSIQMHLSFQSFIDDCVFLYFSEYLAADSNEKFWKFVDLSQHVSFNHDSGIYRPSLLQNVN